MFNFTTIPALALGIGLAVAGPVRADANGHADAGEMQASLDATTSLAHAIRTAEAQSNGHAFAISMEKEDGRYVYKVAVLQKEDSVEYLIDPKSGTVTGSDDEDFLGELFDRDHTTALRTKLANSSLDLTQAVAAAERKTGGRAVEANADEGRNALLFKVQTVRDGVVQQVNIIGKRGKISAITAADRDSLEKEEHGED